MAINMNNAVMLPRSPRRSLFDQSLFSLDLCFQHLELTQSSVRPIAPPSRACLLIPFNVATHLNACMLYLASHLPTISSLTILEFDELIRDTASEVIRAARTGFHVRVDANLVFSSSPPSMEDTIILEEMFAGEPRDQYPTGASSTALERLKTQRFCFDSDAGTEGETCVVCLEELSGGAFLTRMPCSHTFHESCIFEWLKNANSCPLCRCELEDD
ncbi:hypothetical protein K2173_000275 [Erythroxylum novogranatense]|uniref:RING-type domain-containing protein n=1 Tax=Erythroxylum novogranatense TaxID=1862640 RepID=A0AAV8SWQ5_9ROSI|nr:hypothetical protein K2173_000275 [Erythroxylum novogranatense]